MILDDLILVKNFLDSFFEFLFVSTMLVIKNYVNRKFHCLRYRTTLRFDFSNRVWPVGKALVFDIQNLKFQDFNCACI